jgi:hypothetical protein
MLKKTPSANLCLLYLPAADITRKLAKSFGISLDFSIVVLGGCWLNGRLHIVARCDINTV